MTVEHFLSFGKVAFDFRDAGLVLVEGENRDDRSARSNGSGKSAMIDALVWCLFGTTLRGYDGDEVVHRKVGADCLVTVTVDDGVDVYTVARARRHSAFKNSLRLFREHPGLEDEDLSLGNNAETQELVEKVIGCSRRTFLSSVVFGQDRSYRFSSLTDKDQKEILDEVLGVERFAEAGRLARVLAASAADDLGEVTGSIERARDSWNEELNDAASLREKDETFAGSRRQRVESVRDKLAEAKLAAKIGGSADVDSLTDKRDLARRENVAATKKLGKEVDARAEWKAASESAKTKLVELVHALKHWEKLDDSKCPTCGQKLAAAASKKGIADQRKRVEVAHASAESAAGAFEVSQEKTDQAKAAQRKTEADLALAEAALNEAARMCVAAEAAKVRVGELEARIEELTAEENPFKKLADKADKKCAQLKAQVEELTSQEAELQGALRLAEFWVEAFGAKGLRSLLLDTSLPLLNDEAARVSRAVTGGAIKVEFSAQSELKSGKTVERFEVRVDNKHGANTYAGNSSGEKAKVDLCVGLALQRLVASRSKASFNVVFLDEIFDHLDEAAHERVVDVLAEISKESVFVVSHNEDLKAWFPATLTIVKQGGFSTVAR